MNLYRMVKDMQSCNQTLGMSVYEHGKSVHAYYNDLINHLTTGDPLVNKWVIPDWVYEYKPFLLLNQHHARQMKTYQVLHDCGKPNCIEVDERGTHFPNHAEVSAKLYASLENSDSVVTSMIAQDMQVHIMKAVDVEEFCNQDVRTVCSLLLSALAEVHSNANMFGGTSSTSFKIKQKQITKRGKAILKLLEKKFCTV